MSQNEMEQIKGQNILLKGLVQTFYKLHRDNFRAQYNVECSCLACKKANQILNPPTQQQSCPDCG